MVRPAYTAVIRDQVTQTDKTQETCHVTWYVRVWLAEHQFGEDEWQCPTSVSERVRRQQEWKVRASQRL